MEKGRRKRRKIKVGRILLAIVLLVVVLVGVFLLTKGKEIVVTKNTMYIASNTNVVKIYTLNEEDILKEEKELARGTKVTAYDNKIEKDNIKYTKIDYDKNIYYINSESLVKDLKDVVLEKEKYVRTSVTIYQNETDSKIASFIKKGNKLEITGYDKLLEDGTVNMYKIKKDDIEGWTYSKYLVDTEEEATAVYNENGVYDTHKDRKYKSRELYGGKASTLDYYPYTKVEFEDNRLMKSAKEMD